MCVGCPCVCGPPSNVHGPDRQYSIKPVITTYSSRLLNGEVAVRGVSALPACLPGLGWGWEGCCLAGLGGMPLWACLDREVWLFVRGPGDPWFYCFVCQTPGEGSMNSQTELSIRGLGAWVLSRLCGTEAALWDDLGSTLESLERNNRMKRKTCWQQSLDIQVLLVRPPTSCLAGDQSHKHEGTHSSHHA